MTRDDIIALTIKEEGGYVDNPGDPGGPTKYGQTQKDVDAARAQFPDLPANVADLTVAQAARMYAADEWVAVRGDVLLSIHPGIAALAFDTAVNEGAETAAMLLQQAAGAQVDGKIGPSTIAAVATQDAAGLARDYAAHGAAHYAKFQATESQFMLGWMRRLFTVYTAAITS